MCTYADTVDSDILAAARAAQRNETTSLREEVSKRRAEVSLARLAANLAEFEATLNKILDRQRDLEERHEQQIAAALLMVSTI